MALRCLKCKAGVLLNRSHLDLLLHFKWCSEKKLILVSWPKKNGRHLVAYVLTVKNVMFIKTGLNERSKLVMAFIEKFSFPLLLCFYFHHSYSPVFRRVGFSLKASQYDQVNWFHFTVLHIFARLGVFLSEIRLLNYEDRSGNRYSVDLYLFVPLFTSRIVFPQLGESH